MRNHKQRALAHVTDLTKFNAAVMERAIDEIFAEGGKTSTNSDQWKTLLKFVTADQRSLSQPMIQHEINALNLVTDLTKFNAAVMERAIDEIFQRVERKVLKVTDGKHFWKM